MLPKKRETFSAIPDRRYKRPPREMTTSQRGYDTTWQKLRLEKLNEFPFCEAIIDDATSRQCLKPATEIDHIVPIKKDPRLRLDKSNLQSMCKSCHSRKTANENKRQRKP